jgi:hypothetical protein
MVDLYLDPDIASPRKVSVWYAFWGEASSRQEYYDICGRRTRALPRWCANSIERLIEETGQPQLDPDGIALGLIGVLEILWQDFAFQTEEDIDRRGAKRRCMAYLRSIFPGEFPRWSYDDAGLAASERAELFDGTWQFVGHRAAARHRRRLSRRGYRHRTDFAGAGRGGRGPRLARLAVRRCRTGSSSGNQGRFVNAPRMPHPRHWSLRSTDRAACAGPAPDLGVMDLGFRRDLLFVRIERRLGERAFEHAAARRPGDFPDAAARAAIEIEVAADWKIVVEQWLGNALPEDLPRRAARASSARSDALWDQTRLADKDPSQVIDWSAVLVREPQAWSAARYRAWPRSFGAGGGGDYRWRRLFLPPNQLIEARPDGLSILQALPIAPGKRASAVSNTPLSTRRAPRVP